MSEILKIAEQIKNKIEQLEEHRLLLKDSAFAKADSAGDYEKHLAITIVRLRNGAEMALEGTIVKNPPVSVLLPISKGICWEKAIKRDKDEALYKVYIQTLECLRAELNGFQSMNRFLSEA